MTASLKPRTDAQIARVIDALEKVNQALRDAKQAMFYAQMSEYETIRGVAEQMFDLTASIAESGLRGSHLKSLAKSLEIRITEARVRYEGQDEINMPYAREWLVAMEEMRQRLLGEM